MVKKYQPSNGTEGEAFIDHWCGRCARDNFNPGTGQGGCPILAYSLALDLSDPEYPAQWQYGDDGQPKCTAFEDKAAPLAIMTDADRKYLAWRAAASACDDPTEYNATPEDTIPMYPEEDTSVEGTSDANAK